MGVDALIDTSQKEVPERCEHAKHEGVFPDNHLYLCTFTGHCGEIVSYGGLPYCGIELRRGSTQAEKKTTDIRQSVPIA